MKSFLKSLLRSSPIPLSKNHRYDLQTKQVFKRHLQRDSNCIDVGCHKGEIMDLILKYAPDGRHWGFEPIPQFYEGLLKKYSGRPNCTILNYALSNTTGTTTFNYVVSNPAYSGLQKRSYDRAGEVDRQIEVKTELLDNLIPEGTAIALIKIDVEGAELQVLEGARNLIARQKPLVIFEHGLGASDHYGTTPEMIFDFFHACGMSVSTLTNFLKKKPALSSAEFQNQYETGRNYYFIAFHKI